MDSFFGAFWAPVISQPPAVWALVFHAQLDEIDGVTLTIYNRRTGISEIVNVNESHAVWADISRRTVASVGDTLLIEMRDTSGQLIRTLHHEIDAPDIRRAFTELILTPEHLKPGTDRTPSQLSKPVQSGNVDTVSISRRRTCEYSYLLAGRKNHPIA